MPDSTGSGVTPNRPGIRHLLDDEQPKLLAVAGLWERHEVAGRTDTRKRFTHPLVGPITLDCQILTSENLMERLVVFTATPGSQDAKRLALLAVIGT